VIQFWCVFNEVQCQSDKSSNISTLKFHTLGTDKLLLISTLIPNLYNAFVTLKIVLITA